MLKADSFAGRMVTAARDRRPWYHLTVPPRLAAFLVAAGAQRASAADSMTVSLQDIPPGRPASRTNDTAARRDLALAVLAAQKATRMVTPAFVETPSLGPSMVSTLLAADEALRLVLDRADRLLQRDTNNAIVAALSSGVTVHPRGYEDARFIGELFISGNPVILDLTETKNATATRLIDFAAGLIFGLRGHIERIASQMFLLLPAENPRQAGYLLSLRTSATAARAAVSRLVMIISDETYRYTPEPTLPWESQPNAPNRARKLAEIIESDIGRLQGIVLPLDVAEIDLHTITTLTLEDLADATWTERTRWPSIELAEQVRRISDEVEPGIYRVQGGWQRTTANMAPAF